MTIYCGVDFHARQQTVAYCDTADGELQLRELGHEGGNVRDFYSAFAVEVVVGSEAGGYSTWFIKKKVRASQCFKSFHTAERTPEGIEAMHMIRKGQSKRLTGSDAQGQSTFVASLFGIAA